MDAEFIEVKYLRRKKNRRLELPRIDRALDGDVLLGYRKEEIPAQLITLKRTRNTKALQEIYRDIFEEVDLTTGKIRGVLDAPLMNEVELRLPDNYIGRYNKPKLEKFIAILRNGLNLKDACLLMGWNPGVISQYIMDNRYNLGRVVEAARLEYKLFHVRRLNNHDYGHQSSAWMLERTHRDEYGREVKVTAKNDVPDQVFQFGDKEIRF